MLRYNFFLVDYVADEVILLGVLVIAGAYLLYTAGGSKTCTQTQLRNCANASAGLSNGAKVNAGVANIKMVWDFYSTSSNTSAAVTAMKSNDSAFLLDFYNKQFTVGCCDQEAWWRELRAASITMANKYHVTLKPLPATWIEFNNFTNAMVRYHI